MVDLGSNQMLAIVDADDETRVPAKKCSTHFSGEVLSLAITITS
jgi:hypothetical protein